MNDANGNNENTNGSEKMEMEMEIGGYIITDSGNVSVIVNGESHTIAFDHVNYDQIIKALKSGDAVKLVKFMDVGAQVEAASNGKVAVINGSVWYDSKEIVSPLTDRIVRFVKEDLPFEPMVAFLDNLMLNPSRVAVQELYLFLDQNEMPITEDGCMLAYRKVDNDYMSFHSNPDGTTNRNMVGDVVEMQRNEVDDIRDNTCSNGLHFCSLSYLPKYYGGSGRVVIVKINPADVVSIPSDYNNAKGRTCKYEVIAEHTDPKKEYVDFTDAALVTASGGEYEDDEYQEYIEEFCEECGSVLDGDNCPNCDGEGMEIPIPESGIPYHNQRDNKGRFMKK